jgi:phosphoglycerate dehydrogenase-like enzyme
MWARVRSSPSNKVLDGVDPEPLLPGHPFWIVVNVVLTPHDSGEVRGCTIELQKQFNANFRRYRFGLPLHVSSTTTRIRADGRRVRSDAA